MMISAVNVLNTDFLLEYARNGGESGELRAAMCDILEPIICKKIVYAYCDWSL